MSDAEKLTESPRRSVFNDTIRHDDWWHHFINSVSDEDFLLMEAECNAYAQKDENTQNETLLYDVEEPSFLRRASISENTFSNSVLSPIKMVGLRCPPTILEESNISNTKSSNAFCEKENIQTVNSSVYDIFPKQKPRNFYNFDVKPSKEVNREKLKANSPSWLSVFPKRRARNFYNFDLNSSKDENKENLLDLINFHTTEGSFSNDSYDSPIREEFSDTLDAVEYLMDKGKKLQEKKFAMSQMVASPFSSRNRNETDTKQTKSKTHFMSHINESRDSSIDSVMDMSFLN